MSIGSRYLDWLEGRIPPSEMDLHRYFAYRRDQGIGESSLRTTFAVLQKLYQANRWDWPLVSENFLEAPLKVNTPAFTREEVEQLILNRGLYSKGERFYLALATIFAPKRIDLARIKNRDIKNQSIHIDTEKRGEKRKHLIPGEIMPYIEAYRPRERNVSTLSAMFGRICEKGLGGERHGYGWESIRYTIDKLLPEALEKANKPVALVGYFLSWNRRTTDTKFLVVPMGGLCVYPEPLSEDCFLIDREIFQVHPFIPYWRK